MGSERPRRVAEQIQRFLSAKLITELRDPRLGFATITGVEISPDLKSARVFVTFLEPDPAKRADSLLALNQAAGRFRHDLGHDLRLRYAPTLRFEEDRSIERADRIERIIKTLHEDEPNRPPVEPGQPPVENSAPDSEESSTPEDETPEDDIRE